MTSNALHTAKTDVFWANTSVGSFVSARSICRDIAQLVPTISGAQNDRRVILREVLEASRATEVGQAKSQPQKHLTPSPQKPGEKSKNGSASCLDLNLQRAQRSLSLREKKKRK